MQTLINGAQVIQPSSFEAFAAQSPQNAVQTFDTSDRSATLNAAYRRLFKENRSLDFHRNASLDSRFLNGQLTTRELIRDMLCSDMYINFILANNSNFRFVALCFERVLGRPALQDEVYQWSSLLASEGLNSFAAKLTGSAEYLEAFGDDVVPFRRSEKLSSSDQDMPALPKELSIKRYVGPGNVNQLNPTGPSTWVNNQPPAIARNAGAVLTVAGVLELVRIVATVALDAFSTGGM